VQHYLPDLLLRHVTPSSLSPCSKDQFFPSYKRIDPHDQKAHDPEIQDQQTHDPSTHNQVNRITLDTQVQAPLLEAEVEVEAEETQQQNIEHLIDDATWI